MIKNVLENIGGVGAFGVISICLFFAFFTGVVLWAISLGKADLKSISSLPLDDGAPASGPKTPSGTSNL